MVFLYSLFITLLRFYRGNKTPTLESIASETVSNATKTLKETNNHENLVRARHVKTRLCPYEAHFGEKRVYIAKQIVRSKMKGQNTLLRKYDLTSHDEDTIISKIESLKSSDPVSFGQKLRGIEGRFTERYFSQVLDLFPESSRPEKRKKFKAYDGVNNIFNLAYEVLHWKVHRAIIKAKMEPFLGFLHSVQYGKPSLVCDLQELHRYQVDDFVIQFCQGLKERDFTLKSESMSRKRKGKREYLNNTETKRMMRELEGFFDSKVEIPLIRHGKKQRLETLISTRKPCYLRNI